MENEASYNQVLFDNDNMILEVVHQIETTGTGCAGYSIRHDCILVAKLKRYLVLDDAICLTNTIAKFFTFCFGFMAEIQEFKPHFEGYDSPVFCHGSFLKGSPSIASNLPDIPFKLNVIENSIEEYISHWLHPDNNLRSARDMVVSLMAYPWEMPIDLRFVAASQALEALTRVDNDSLAVPADDYSRYVETIKKSITDQEALAWITHRMPGSSKGQTRMLSDFLKTHSEIAEWLIGDTNTFIRRHIDLRNSYTHRSSSANNSDTAHYEMLYRHTECVLMLCYGIIWQELGMSPEALIKQIEESGFRNYQLYEIRELYKKDEQQ